jgi:DeoR family fructose operon transcriptional repressor
MCFLGINGVDHEIGLTVVNRQETTIKKAIIKASNKVVTLAISNKIGTTQPFKVCDLESLDVLVTDLDPNDPLLQEYHRNGIKVI